AQIERPAQDARVEIAGGNVAVVPDQHGRKVNQSATLAEIEQAVLAQRTVVAIQVDDVAPDVTASDLAPVAAKARDALRKGLVLTAEDKKFPMAATDLGDLLTVSRGSNDWSLSLKQDGVANLVRRVDDQFTHPSLDARFGWDNGKLYLPSGP